MKALDSNGREVRVGDILEVKVKYKVLKVREGGSLLVQKVYDFVGADHCTVIEENEDGVL